MGRALSRRARRRSSRSSRPRPRARARRPPPPLRAWRPSWRARASTAGARPTRRPDEARRMRRPDPAPPARRRCGPARVRRTAAVSGVVASGERGPPVAHASVRGAAGAGLLHAGRSRGHRNHENWAQGCFVAGDHCKNKVGGRGGQPCTTRQQFCGPCERASPFLARQECRGATQLAHSPPQAGAPSICAMSSLQVTCTCMPGGALAAVVPGAPAVPLDFLCPANSTVPQPVHFLPAGTVQAPSSRGGSCCITSRSWAHGLLCITGAFAATCIIRTGACCLWRVAAGASVLSAFKGNAGAHCCTKSRCLCVLPVSTCSKYANPRTVELHSCGLT